MEILVDTEILRREKISPNEFIILNIVKEKGDEEVDNLWFPYLKDLVSIDEKGLIETSEYIKLPIKSIPKRFKLSEKGMSLLKNNKEDIDIDNIFEKEV